MKRKKVVIAAAVLAIAAGIAAWFLFPRERGDGAIRVSGNIEVTDVDVAFKIPGRVVQRAVDEGMAVSAGQLVARLDSSDLEGEVSVRQAELRAAAAALEELAAGSRPQEIARAKAAVAAAKAEAERLSKDFSRAKTLLEREAIAR